MKIAGIIAEYNPFHNGHAYHIEQTKKITGADRVIVAMSGNFTQRGAPAIYDKYSRTLAALNAGADLVIQIPSVYSLSSAEFFGKAAVSLLDSTGLVEYLSFGTEAGDLENISKVADILYEEPEKYQRSLKQYLKSGETFPVARTRALMEYCPEIVNISEIVASPNNILGIEYLKALKAIGSSMKPMTVKRLGADHNDHYMHGATNVSAKAIREAVSYGSQIESLSEYMNDVSYTSLMGAIENNQTVFENDLSGMMIYKLISEREKGYTKYFDVSQDLSDRIVNNLDKFTCLTEFCDLLKTRDKTYTRISRALFHILLGITDESISSAEYSGMCKYIRILGFRKESEDVISELKTHSSLPLITGYNDAKNLYSEQFKDYVSECRIEDLYYAVQTMKSGIPSKADASRPLVVI